MDRGLAVLLTAVVGGILALQAPINAGLGRATGSIAAALVSFTVGTIALVVVVAVSGESGGLTSTFDVRWYYLIGGLLGAVYVTTALITVKSIGAGGHGHGAADRRRRHRPPWLVRARADLPQRHPDRRRRPALGGDVSRRSLTEWACSPSSR
jgi:Putative inner membrane exporter, YdcZ